MFFFPLLLLFLLGAPSAASACGAITSCEACAANASCTWCVGVDCTGACISRSSAPATVASLCRWTSPPANSTACAAAVSCAAASEQPANGDFEAGPGSGWGRVPSDLNYYVISDNALTGDLALGGTYCAWFGHDNVTSVTGLRQAFTLPAASTATHLSFFVWIQTPDSAPRTGFHTLMVLIDEVPLFARDYTQATEYYVPIEVGVRDFADGAEHTLMVRFFQYGSNEAISPDVTLDNFAFLDSSRSGNLNDGYDVKACALGCAPGVSTSLCRPACNNPKCGLDGNCPVANVAAHSCFDNVPAVGRATMTFCDAYKEETCCRYEEQEGALLAQYNTLEAVCSASEQCTAFIKETKCALCNPHSALFVSGGSLIVCGAYAKSVFSACSKACPNGTTTAEAWFKRMGLGTVSSASNLNCWRGASFDYVDPNALETWVILVGVLVPIGALLILGLAIGAACFIVRKTRKQEKKEMVPEGWVTHTEGATLETVAPAGAGASVELDATGKPASAYVPDGWVGH